MAYGHEGAEGSHARLVVYSGKMMEAMRESWTDARLDDFAKHTDQRFDEVDRRFDEVDHRFDKVDMRFEAVDRRFEEVDRRFDSVERRMENGFAEINVRFDALQRTLLQLGGGLLAALVVLLAALIGLIGTQL